MTISEVWPNAPLALVAVEARYPASGVGPLRPPVHRAVRDRLGTDWVLVDHKHETVEVVLGPGGTKPPGIKVEDVTTMTLRDRTHAVTVRPEGVSVEATRYGGYPAFRSLLATVFEAVEDSIHPDGITRLGIRYIDEIRVPGVSGIEEWAEWVAPSLLAPRVKGLAGTGWAGAAQYQTGPDRCLVLRYGPTDGPVVSPAGPLKRPKPPPPGPLFVLDFDSFWEPSDIPEFSGSSLVAACDELQVPVRTLFDQLITPKLIDEVFRKEPEL